MKDPVRLLKAQLKGSSLRILARKIGVSQTYVWYVINGERPAGVKILKYLGIKKRITVEYR